MHHGESSPVGLAFEDSADEVGAATGSYAVKKAITALNQPGHRVVAQCAIASIEVVQHAVHTSRCHLVNYASAQGTAGRCRAVKVPIRALQDRTERQSTRGIVEAENFFFEGCGSHREYRPSF